MNDGIFFSLSKSYFNSAISAFYYMEQSNLLFKPITLLMAIFYSAILIPASIIFIIFIVFDWVGGITDTLRRVLLNLIDQQSRQIDKSFISFILCPILLGILSPLFLLSLFIPKFYSNSLINVAENELSAIISGAGAFRRINEITWAAANRLFIYVSNTYLIFKPIAAFVAIVYSTVLIIEGSIFLILIPIDWISQLIENIRQGIVRFANEQQRKIRYKTSSFLLSPMVLVLLVPFFLTIILIPKFATSFDMDA